jgi:hypothetical protein
MKKTATLTALALIWMISGFCQTDSSRTFKPFLITTYTYQDPPPGDTTFKNYSPDSLVDYYVTHGILPNKYILYHRILVHVWGSDSHQIIVETEIDKFENILRSSDLATQLINKSFKNEKDRKLFWHRFAMIFNRHEDNIMETWGRFKN